MELKERVLQIFSCYSGGAGDKGVAKDAGMARKFLLREDTHIMTILSSSSLYDNIF